MSAIFDRKQLAGWEPITEGYWLDKGTYYGGGAFGRVYRGYSDALNALIAVKVIPSDRFQAREAEVLKVLSSLRHKNIVGYFGCHASASRGEHYLFLEHCPGGTLTDLIRKGLSQRQALRLFRQLLEGMCYMNVKGKVHRDLKPDNILLGQEQDIKISDFGLSRETGGVEMTGRRGTPLYAGPEVFLEEAEEGYGANCDVWSAGLILYETLTGQSLLASVKSYSQLKGAWLNMERGLLAPSLDRSYHLLWQYFLTWMLQFDPKSRPRFGEVLEQLKRVYRAMEEDLKQQMMAPGLGEEAYRALELVDFKAGRHSTLLEMCEKFVHFRLDIRNEYKYLLMLFAIMRFVSFEKELSRELLYGRVEHQGRPLLSEPEGDPDDPHEAMLRMLLESRRIPLDSRRRFYQDQVRRVIVPKVADCYQRRKESEAVLGGLGEELKTVQDIKEEQPIFDEELFAESMKSVYKAIHRKGRFEGQVSQYPLAELRVYALMLDSLLLDHTHPLAQPGSVSLETVLRRRGELSAMGQQQLLSEVRRMRGLVVGDEA